MERAPRVGNKYGFPRLLAVGERGDEDAGGCRVELAPCTWAWWISDTATFIAMAAIGIAPWLLVAWLHAPLWAALAAGGLLGLLGALTYLWWACKQYYRGGEPHLAHLRCAEGSAVEGSQ